MPAPATADQFLEVLAKSGLLAPAELDAARRRLSRAGRPGDAGLLADALVRDGVLTPFQAEQLLQGRHRNFILSGKYKILRPIGAGGMGQVFLCEHAVMRRQVAVKMLPPARASDPTAVERFHREVRAVAQLAHPNIVTAHDADCDGPHLFLVMEYIDGKNLYNLVNASGAVPPYRAADFVHQAALGLQHAHEHGLVHRDIKPHNLLVDRGGTVKVLDLGLARFFHDEADDLSRRNESSPLGTTDYMAPEQAMDSHTVDIRADIYSLGATFYFLLAGHSPFQGKTAMEKILAHQTRHPPPIRDLRPEVPAWMAAVLDRMLAKDPADRYQTPAQVAEALVPPARPDPWADRAETVGPSASSADKFSLDGIPVEAAHRLPVPRLAPKPPIRRTALVVGAVAAGLLTLGAGIGYLQWPREQGTRDPRPGDPGAGAKGAVAAPPAPRLRLLIPAYFYPGGDGLAEWERLLKAPVAANVVLIANPSSGPGTVTDEKYLRVFDEATKRGFTLIGYVSTQYGKRPAEQVREEIDRWLRLYPGVQGVFFDEQASGIDRVDYYAALYDYARKQRGLRLVVSNPGTICAEEYVARPAADVVCLVESAKAFGQFRPPPWAGQYPASRFAALVCQLGDPEGMKQSLQEMAEKHVGACYLTDEKLPNPWGRLPRYWEAELDALRKANE